MMGVSDIGKVVVLITALSAGEAAANFSQEKSESVTVSFAELDLSKPSGAQALYDRLQRAAAEVCSFNGSSSLLDMQACYENTLSRAVAQIDAPLLREKHER